MSRWPSKTYRIVRILTCSTLRVTIRFSNYQAVCPVRIAVEYGCEHQIRRKGRGTNNTYRKSYSKHMQQGNDINEQV